MDTAGKEAKVNPVDGEIEACDSNWKAYCRGRDAGHDNYVAQALKQNAFYLGDQWDPADLAKLKKQRRPALTINQILSNVNTVRGEHISQRADVTFRPKRNATDAQAMTLSKVIMHILSTNRYEHLEADMFADGLIEDRGYIDCRINFDDNLMGDIALSLEDPAEIIPDPNAKSYDPREWNEVVKTRWLTIDDIELQWGKDKADRLRLISGSDPYGVDSVVREGERTFGDDNQSRVDADPTAIKRARIIERQYRKLAKQRTFVDMQTGDMRLIPDEMDDARIAMIAQTYNLQVASRLVKRVRWTVTADKVLLHDAWSPYRNFTIVPFFPVFRRGKSVGMVRNLLGPQELLNKVESQQLHIVNSTANSGWTVPVGSLVNMTVDELAENGAETGLVIEYLSKGEKPEKILSNSVPTGLDRMGAKALDNLREISGTRALLGVDPPSVSGVRVGSDKQSSLTQLQPIFQNLDRSRGILAELILEMIQAYYTETRVLQITNWEGIEPTTEELTLNGMTPEGAIVNDMRLGEYAVVVATQPARDTFQDTQFAEALQLRDAGIAIPDHHVILNSHLANKTAIAAEAQQLAGLAPPSEQEVAMQDFMMEMNIKMAQAELAKLEATAANLDAQAQLAMAKAQSMVGEAMLTQQQAEFERAEAISAQANDLRKFGANLENKLQLAGIHASNKRELTQFQSASKRAETGLKVAADLAKTKMTVAAKPKPAAKKPAKK